MDTTAIFEFLRSRAKFAVAAAGLFAAGTLASPLERVAWSEARERIGAFSPEALGSSAGTGVALGTLGGFRTVIADVAWLRAFHFWETRDAVACLKFAELAMTLAPEQFFFLENAANYIAFDFPVWEIRRRGGTRQVPAPVRREIHRKAMNEALRLLENAAERMPDDPRVFVLAAQISAMKTDTIYGAVDFRKTAAYYRSACDRPGAPLFAFATYAKFAAEHLPAERGNAEAFLARCRDAAESAEEKRFFEALLAEYFGGENQPPHKSSSSAERRADVSVPASENGASQRTNR